MALKKSQLYTSLWQSCDELRGGMDASQYKDYVLVLLFIKYISDKYADKPFAPIAIPKGASFQDLAALKGKADIGDRINKQIIAPLAQANKLSDLPDFNDPNKLGSGKEMVDRLTNLIAIFESKDLDFSKNRADGDDILGDAYEYLMRHFATESGKSKGQFYTPAEVSRVIASVLGIRTASTNPNTTVYDPTCGSGSLLLKVADEATTEVSIFGQEKDSATSSLARMNMILHDNPRALIQQGNTLTDPKFKEGKAGNDTLKTFDYVVANPPFSDKRWSTGLDTEHDPHERFKSFGTPPAKQGDYAYLLHIIRSLKSTGRAACILPHGVLFRGNAEAEIRRNLIRKGYLQGIIGLPANLFYGTGIPACILVLDKQNAVARKAIFMIDASKGFIKDGPKNRLRSRDLHMIVDVFTNAEVHDGYSRLVPLKLIEKNEYNLNLPRYIDSQEAEDIQDLSGHLQGGIPTRDIDALKDYWDLCPDLRKALFKPNRPGYADLLVEAAELKTTIHQHPQFAGFIKGLEDHFNKWHGSTATRLKKLKPGLHPKELIHELSEGLLAHAEGQPLIDPYAVYQHLMDYWADTMQDDAYLIAADGWVAKPHRILVEDKKGKLKDKGWACDLLPKPYVITHYYPKQQAEIDALSAKLEASSAAQTELEEEHGGEEDAFGPLDKINKANVSAQLKELKGDPEAKDEIAILKKWIKLSNEITAQKKAIKEAEAALDQLAYDRYPQLDEKEVKALVVDDKWMTTLANAVQSELDRVSQTLTGRIRELADRYATPLPAIVDEVETLSARVDQHLETMGLSWT